MDLNCNFLRGGGGGGRREELKPNTFPRGCMDSFWNSTIYGSHILTDCVGGGRSSNQTPSLGVVWIVSGTAQYMAPTF